RHSAHELRAYVFPVSVGITSLMRNGRIEVMVESKNLGKTPAHRVRSWFAISVGPYPQTTFPVEEERANNGSLGPGAFFHMWPQQEINSIRRGEIITGGQAVYIDGRITYRDVFSGKDRVTKYRGYYRGNGTEPDVKAYPLPLMQTPEGNESD